MASLRKVIFGFIALIGVVFLFSAGTVLAASSDIQITEIMYDPAGADTGREWVELKNTGNEPVEIVGTSKTGSWRFFDGGNRLFSTSTILVQGAYLIVVRSTTTFLNDHVGFVGQIVQSSFTLTNTTGTVAFIDQYGVQRSRVDYFSSWGADDNGKTLEKKNLVGDNSAGNWQESANLSGTPGTENSSASLPPPPPPAGEPPPESPPSPPANPSGNDNGNVQIFINEFLSDPNQNEKEWVEIYNAGGSTVDLTGWRIEEGSEEETKLTGTIAPGDYFLVESPKGNLNNSGDIIQLFDYNGGLQDKVAYGSWDDGNKFDNAPVAYDGKTVGRLIGTNTGNNKIDFILTLRPTPRAANLFGIISSGTNPDAPLYYPVAPASIILNEILSNPKGSDQDKEFIEIKNIAAESASLAGWKLVNQAGSSYTLPSAAQISAGGFLVISRKDSRLALKNSGGEKLELYDAANHLVDKTVYEEEAADDLSYNRLSSTSTAWQWSQALTPGRENIIDTPNLAPQIFVVLPNVMFVGEEAVFDASDSFDPEDDELKFSWELEGGVKAEGDSFIYVFEKAGSYSLVLKASDSRGNQAEKKMTIRVMGGEDESKVSESIKSVKSESGKTNRRTCVRGNVAVLPGVFSSQTFYIFDSAEARGWPVYMSKKDFPPLTVGDLVEACGEFGSYQGYERLKTKTRADIRLLAQNQKIEPLVFSVGEIAEENLFALVKISAEVLETGSGYFYLGDEEGEIKAQLKKNVEWKKGLLKAGEKAAVVGIIGKSKNELALWPLSAESIKVAAGNVGEPSAAILGGKKKYWVAGGGGAISLFLAFLSRGKSAFLKSAAAGFVSKIFRR